VNCWDQIKVYLSEAPSTTPELAALCETTVRTMNARMQFYKLRGRVKHNGRFAPKEGRRGGRALFWELV